MFKAKQHMPLILSLLCPGAGQLVQRRWIVGLLYLMVSLTLCISLIAVVIGMMAKNMDAAMAFAEGAPDKDFAADPTRTIIGIMAAVIIVYLAGMVDTYLAFKRAIQRNIKQQLHISE